MRDTVTNHALMKEVMADLREKGARCCLLVTGEYPNKDKTIRAVLKDGRIWDIHDVREYNWGNEAMVTCATE